MSVEVSVIIPIKNEHDQYIHQCLESLRKLDFASTFEILVLKGGNRAQARNLGLKRARGEIIAFIDSDCVAPENWLSMLVCSLKEDKTLGGVGGINFSPPESPFLGKAIDFVFSSYLGSLGSASLHNPAKPVFVKALACINSVFWKKHLKNIGGFDEEFELCEDTNLSYKVRALGHKLLLDPRILVWHYRRDTIKRFATQFFLYGLGRMRSILTNKAYASKAIIATLVGILLFPLISFFFPLFALLALSAYLSIILIKGFQGAIRNKDFRFLFLVPGLFIIQHFSYFLGVVYGVTKGRWKKRKGLCEVFYHEIVKK